MEAADWLVRKFIKCQLLRTINFFVFKEIGAETDENAPGP